MIADEIAWTSELDSSECNIVSTLLERYNPWTEWMKDYEVEPLSWMRLAAMLLRDVPMPTAVNRIALGLTAAEAEGVRNLIEAMQEGNSGYEGNGFDWEVWLGFWHWHDKPPYEAQLGETLRNFFGSGDIAWFVSVVRDRSIAPHALLWFLLNAIRGWAARADDVQAVAPGNRWLLELHAGARVDADPLAALLAHFYDRFRAAGHELAHPLPDLLEIDKPPQARDATRRSSLHPFGERKGWTPAHNQGVGPASVLPTRGESFPGDAASARLFQHEFKQFLAKDNPSIKTPTRKREKALRTKFG